MRWVLQATFSWDPSAARYLPFRSCPSACCRLLREYGAQHVPACREWAPFAALLQKRLQQSQTSVRWHSAVSAVEVGAERSSCSPCINRAYAAGGDHGIFLCWMQYRSCHAQNFFRACRATAGMADLLRCGLRSFATGREAARGLVQAVCRALGIPAS